MWRLFCHCLFLFPPSFGASGRLCFLIVALHGFLSIHRNIGICKTYRFADPDIKGNCYTMYCQRETTLSKMLFAF